MFFFLQKEYFLNHLPFQGNLFPVSPPQGLYWLNFTLSEINEPPHFLFSIENELKYSQK